jgi:hypothetical protein
MSRCRHAMLYRFALADSVLLFPNPLSAAAAQPRWLAGWLTAAVLRCYGSVRPGFKAGL